MSHRDLEIWEMARTLSVDIHRMTLAKLPKFEMFEDASQIRRAIKSVRGNIVEGYGRRRYKQEFVKHLVYAHAACDETTDHLLTLFETGSLGDETIYRDLAARLDTLGRKMYKFLQAVETSHQSVK